MVIEDTLKANADGPVRSTANQPFALFRADVNLAAIRHCGTNVAGTHDTGLNRKGPNP